MSMNLFAASNQWATRPDDERFSSLQEMYDACKGYADTARDFPVQLNTLRLAAMVNDGNPEAGAAELALVGKSGTAARLTNYAFQQVAQYAQCPPEYVRGLPPQLAMDNVNYGLGKLEGNAKMLTHTNGSLLVRCLTSAGYARIWNYQIIEKLLPLTVNGWQVPPARPALPNQKGTRIATESDVLLNSQRANELAIKVGDTIAPAGLYASDKDMFAFMVNENRMIDHGGDGGLSTGFFVQNGEVPGISLKFTKFLYDSICGNHIVWGAKNVQELRIVHKGDATENFAARIEEELKTYATQSAIEDVQRIQAAKNFLIADTRQDVIDTLFGNKAIGLGRKQLEACYDAAIEQADRPLAASPRSAWGFAQGVTRLSQLQPFADARNKMDTAAGNILSLSA